MNESESPDEPPYWQRKWMDELDKRLTEGDALRKEATLILKEANEKALGLAREAQVYRDDAFRALEERINAERNTYATKSELDASEDKVTVLIKPLFETVVTRGQLYAASVLIVGVLGLVVAWANGGLHG
jgi:hypothetical protein